MTLAVIPIGPKRPSTLPYVLRSLAEYADVDEVVTVGERPKGIEPDLHIDSPNTQKPHLNILGHLRRVCTQVNGEFIWTDDDVFTIKPWVPGIYTRQYSIARHLRDFPNRGTYSKAVKASVQLLKRDGYDPEKVPCGPCHRPWLVTAKQVLKVVDIIEPYGGSFRTYYAAGVETIPAADAKVTGRGMPKPDRDVISVYSDSWRLNAGRIIRETFVTPSRWEVPTENTDAVASGRARGPSKHRRG